MSPDGSKVAVGAHDTTIYILNVKDLSVIARCNAHNSFITAIDWTQDGSHIKSVCGAYELLWHNTVTGEQNKNPSEFKDTDYTTNTCKFGWSVQGIFPKNQQDGSFINSLDSSSDGKMIVVGDDYGLVRFYRNPCLFGHTSYNLRAHCSHVTTVKFCPEDSS